MDSRASKTISETEEKISVYLELRTEMKEKAALYKQLRTWLKSQGSFSTEHYVVVVEPGQRKGFKTIEEILEEKLLTLEEIEVLRKVHNYELLHVAEKSAKDPGKNPDK